MRLFIAVRLEEKLLDALTNFQEGLKAEGMRGRYTPRENLHVTLAFIGEYGDIDKVMDAMEKAGFEPFTIRLGGTGLFFGKYWGTGIEENEHLTGYVKKLRRALSESEIPYDRKRFFPHITLIREPSFRGVSAASGGMDAPETTPPSGEMVVRGASLMRSDRGKHGMIYTEIGKVGA